MKTLLILLILTLSCCLHHGAAGTIALDALLEEPCCENVTEVIIPKERVSKVTETPKHCSIQAIIVTTVCENRFCVDPNTRWAKRLRRTWKPSHVKMSKALCPKKAENESH